MSVESFINSRPLKIMDYKANEKDTIGKLQEIIEKKSLLENEIEHDVFAS